MRVFERYIEDYCGHAAFEMVKSVKPKREINFFFYKNFPVINLKSKKQKYSSKHFLPTMHAKQVPQSPYPTHITVALILSICIGLKILCFLHFYEKEIRTEKLVATSSD